jgi:putative ABC transport system permease protein
MSQIFEYIKIAFMNIISNKGRSVLTMLGIIIGISSVIMVISIGAGLTNQVNGELNAMAGGQLYLYSKPNESGESLSFTSEDFDYLEEKVDHIKGITPSYGLYGTCVGNKGEFDASVSAGTESLEYTTTDPIVKGKYFSKEDNYAGKKVCVLTESSAVQLFGTTDVIGMSFEVSLYGISKDLTVIGIRQDNASTLMNMMGYEDSAVKIEVPISILSSFGFYVDSFEGFYIIADSAEYATDIAANAMSVIEAKYNVRGENLISIENFNDYMTQINSVLGYITIFVVFVAAISLLVGGIGVMNIMLVSVTERTREIGIRKALGARTGSILLQFLSEAAIITLVGGIIGIIIGNFGAILVCSIMGSKAELSMVTVLGASVFSSAVGIFFGIYPAKKAAKLSPIEAPRHD